MRNRKISAKEINFENAFNEFKNLIEETERTKKADITAFKNFRGKSSLHELFMIILMAVVSFMDYDDAPYDIPYFNYTESEENMNEMFCLSGLITTIVRKLYNEKG